MAGRFRLSIASLILVNLIPLAGVLFLGWKASAVVLLYWFENVVVGVFNVLKMIMARGKPSGKARYYVDNKPVETVKKSFSILFFMAHFGIFTLVHGLFVMSLFVKDLPGASYMAWAAGSLFLSHGISYFVHFIQNGEYRRVASQDLFFQPYKRVVVLHLTIIFGAFAATALGQPAFILVIMIILKIIVDIWAHRTEHKSFAAQT